VAERLGVKPAKAGVAGRLGPKPVKGTAARSNADGPEGEEADGWATGLPEELVEQMKAFKPAAGSAGRGAKRQRGGDAEGGLAEADGPAWRRRVEVRKKGTQARGRVNFGLGDAGVVEAKGSERKPRSSKSTTKKNTKKHKKKTRRSVYTTYSSDDEEYDPGEEHEVEGLRLGAFDYSAQGSASGKKRRASFGVMSKKKRSAGSVDFGLDGPDVVEENRAPPPRRGTGAKGRKRTQDKHEVDYGLIAKDGRKKRKTGERKRRGSEGNQVDYGLGPVHGGGGGKVAKARKFQQGGFGSTANKGSKKSRRNSRSRKGSFGAVNSGKVNFGV
jgi:hypothetical protein